MLLLVALIALIALIALMGANLGDCSAHAHAFDRAPQTAAALIGLLICI